jgi:hypothetical protein
MGVNAGIGQNPLVQEFLSTCVRVRDGDSFGAVVGGGAKDASQNVVIVGDGVLITLEDDRTASVTTAISISIIVVGFAASCLGQKLALTETRKNVRVGEDVETTRASGITITSPQRSASQLDGSQG